VVSPSPSISGVSAVNPLVAFYDIHGGKREMVFFYFVPDTTRQIEINQTAKYEFASSNTTRTTVTFDACFVWKLAPLADERSGFFIENLSRRLM
jgi:hypothetical protein